MSNRQVSPPATKGKISFTNESVVLKGIIDKDTIPQLWFDFKSITDLSSLSRIELSEVLTVDSAGVAFIEEVAYELKKKNESLKEHKLEDIFMNPSPQILDSLRIFSQEKLPVRPRFKQVGYFEGLGDTFIESKSGFVEMLVLSSEIFYWSIVGLWKKKGARKGSLIQQAGLIGVDSVPIIFLLSFIIGLILSLQSAVQLRLFGANIFVADLIAISMLREMGPMMTAIIIAGRSGSAIASEIATMKVTEELDALKMMAINPIRYVVVPKFHAITICMPLLVTISIIVGIFGGVIVAVTYLNISPTAFYNQMANALAFKDLFTTLLKSTIFAWAIVIIGSFYGFRVVGGAEGVGKATTLSVVASIFAVIVIDVIFSLIYIA
jgi:phospholipid/cholesterol/gamma-HCH transport system permease protein